jgi:HAD superfamily hydrolase (TIGR01549 family)
VLFDLDDTLFDHRHAARAALSVVHAEHACFQRWPLDEFEGVHARLLEDLHAGVIAGSLGIDEARTERFRRLFAAAGIEGDAAPLTSATTRYRAAYLEARRPVDGALALLEALAPRVRIGIVSNNLVEEQRDKLRLCGFSPYVDALVVSEEAGVSKPNPEIFAIALRRLECEAADAVMIGDSWAADIEGARAAGIRAIWFNPAGRPIPARAKPAAVLAAFDPIGPALEAIFPCVLA